MLNITSHQRSTNLKTTMRYHLTPVRMAIIKKITNKNVGKDVEFGEPLYAVGGNVNLGSHDGKHYGSSYKKKKRMTT